MSSPAKRTALREEENRPAQPAGQRQRGDRAGPVQPGRQRVRAGDVPGDRGQRRADLAYLLLSEVQLRQRGADLVLAGRGQVPGRQLREAGPPGRGAQVRARRGAVVEQHRVDPLHPRGVLGAQVMAGLQPLPPVQHRVRRQVALRELAAGQQFALQPGIGPVGLGPPLGPPPRAAISAGSPTCAVNPAARTSCATYRHPVHPSIARCTCPRPANPASQPRTWSRSAGRTWPRHASPVPVPARSKVTC